MRTAILTAVDLDPGFAPYYVHALRYLVAFGDWRFFEYMEMYRGVVSEDRANRYQMQWDYFHGHDEKRAAAEAYYEANPTSAMNTLWEVELRSDSTTERSLELLELASEGSPGPAILRVPMLAALGRLSEIGDGGDGLSEAFALGAGAVILDQPFAGVTPTEGAERIAQAVERAPLDEQGEDYDEITEELEVLSSVGRLLARGDARGAKDRLDDLGIPRVVNSTLSWWPVFYAEALARSGDSRGAIAWYESNLVPWRALARLRLGELYEAGGDAEKARENYAGFLRLYAGADDSVADVVARARTGLARVGG